jgi:hypothetical protein
MTVSSFASVATEIVTSTDTEVRVDVSPSLIVVSIDYISSACDWLVVTSTSLSIEVDPSIVDTIVLESSTPELTIVVSTTSSTSVTILTSVH